MEFALNQEVLDHFLDAVSIVVATRDAQMRPTFTRVFGITGEPGGDRVTIYAAAPTAAAMLENLRANGAIAAQVASWTNFRSYQIKGTFLKAGPAGPEADAIIDATCKKVVETVGRIVGEKFGAGWGRFVARPILSVEFRATEGFIQTPGPNAGARIAG